MKKIEDITEKDLAKSNLFTKKEKMKVARIYLDLPSAGRKNSATRKWFEGLSQRRKEKLLFSVSEKLSQIIMDQV